MVASSWFPSKLTSNCLHFSFPLSLMWFVMRKWTLSWWLSLWFSLFSKLTFTNCIFHFYPMLRMIINSDDKKNTKPCLGDNFCLYEIKTVNYHKTYFFHPLCYSQGLCVILRVIKMASWQCNFIEHFECICVFVLSAYGAVALQFRLIWSVLGILDSTNPREG